MYTTSRKSGKAIKSQLLISPKPTFLWSGSRERGFVSSDRLLIKSSFLRTSVAATAKKKKREDRKSVTRTTETFSFRGAEATNERRNERRNERTDREGTSSGVECREISNRRRCPRAPPRDASLPPSANRGRRRSRILTRLMRSPSSYSADLMSDMCSGKRIFRTGRTPGDSRTNSLPLPLPFREKTRLSPFSQ